MKKCTRCGCFNKNIHTTCIDCGHLLTDAVKMSEGESDDILDDILDKASRYVDPFSFKPRHQIAFYVALILTIANIVSLCISLIQPEMAFVSIVSGMISAIIARFSRTLWNIEKFFLEFKIKGDIEPSDWWYISREILIFGLLIISLFMFIVGF